MLVSWRVCSIGFALKILKINPEGPSHECTSRTVLVMVKGDIDLDLLKVILLILYHGFHHQLNHHWRNIIICVYHLMQIKGFAMFEEDT